MTMLIAFARSFAPRLLKLLALALLLGLSGAVNASQCRVSTPHWNQMHLASVVLTHESGETTHIRARIADEAGERSAGFQHICPQIIEISAILFVYKQAQIRLFHMNNVHDALDIGFFDHEGKLFKVTRMEPSSTGRNLYSSERKSQYALETRAGFFDENGLKAGAVFLSYR